MRKLNTRSGAVARVSAMEIKYVTHAPCETDFSPTHKSEFCTVTVHTECRKYNVIIHAQSTSHTAAYSCMLIIALASVAGLAALVGHSSAKAVFGTVISSCLPSSISASEDRKCSHSDSSEFHRRNRHPLD